MLGGKTEELLPFDPNIIETVAMRQSPPTRFGAKYRSFLSNHRKVTVFLWANVVNIASNAHGAVSRLDVKTLEGNKAFSVQADKYVLACGAIENARLMLASKQPDGTGLGNHNDLVGRYFMDHPSGGAGIITLDNYQIPSLYTHMQTSSDGIPLHFLSRLTDQTIANNDLLNISFWLTPITLNSDEQSLAISQARGMSGLKNTVKYILGRPDASHYSLSEEYCKFINNSASMVTGAFFNKKPPQTNTFLLRFESEQTPTHDNYVSLAEETDVFGVAKANLNWAPSTDDFESIKKSALIYGREIGRTGIGRLKLEERDDLPYWGVSTAWHHMGTTRMATNAKEGVVDQNCKVFGVQNLYIAGSSVFPTGGRSNPTLTLVALSIRLADHLKASFND